MHVALLRGINVGGRGILPMKDLAAIFTAAGASSVSTYIQSGNVVFDAPDPIAIAAAVREQIVQRYGYPGRIILRSAAEMKTAAAANPFVRAGIVPEWLHVYFLDEEPAAALLKALHPERSPGDTFVVKNREVYLHLPQGMARTKLSNIYFDTQLKTVSTARNWRTVQKLVEMMQPK